ncbi:conjugal transfer protein TraR [Metabacillus iocasae]|uniref:RNA polymerase-binding transcription factor DksA n=1 Tax=Priestia iocasae TaxID=2291674 RepID=A0ABS2QQR4_9BACI|nr:conjugal transfer protein TraR [Metabacillus iocasae]MBM7701792.1 RNA polymerase-binding transcription factor DksA [Metabacillus iocasae]
MYDYYLPIEQELVIVKEELENRLMRYNPDSLMIQTDKERYLMETIKADLRDVERALTKLEFGVFGIDELTGERMPIEKLKVIPTARTEEDLFVLRY